MDKGRIIQDGCRLKGSARYYTQAIITKGPALFKKVDMVMKDAIPGKQEGQAVEAVFGKQRVYNSS